MLVFWGSSGWDLLFSWASPPALDGLPVRVFSSMGVRHPTLVVFCWAPADSLKGPPHFLGGFMIVIFSLGPADLLRGLSDLTGDPGVADPFFFSLWSKWDSNITPWGWSANQWGAHFQGPITFHHLSSTAESCTSVVTRDFPSLLLSFWFWPSTSEVYVKSQFCIL